MEVKMEQLWKQVLAEEFECPYFIQLIKRLEAEKQAGKIIYPPEKQIFNAFYLTPFDEVKVVIMGQDPYHGEGQANGLCFSVNKGITIPPSLRNIYKELQVDIGCTIPTHGDLSHWSKQGVFLLNASLTLLNAAPMSHAQIGWAAFTDAVIRKLSEKKDHLIFLLWGKFAQSKLQLINQDKHKILIAAHPSPLSAHNGFFGCKHFSKTNECLATFGYPPIDWQIKE